MTGNGLTTAQLTELVATEQGLQIKGSIDFDNAASIFSKGKMLLERQAANHLQVDLAQLGDSNTIALAVLVQWLRAFEPRQDIQLINVPEKLQAIIKTANLTEAFGLVA